jgi:hypothetical protein
MKSSPDNYSINTTISGPYIYDTILLAKMNRVLFYLEMGKIKRDKKTYFYRSYKNLNRFSYIKELKISFVKIWVRVYLLVVYLCFLIYSYFTYIIHVIELLCYNWRFANFWLEIFHRHIWCVFLLFIDVFLLFVSVLNQLHPFSICIYVQFCDFSKFTFFHLLWLYLWLFKGKFCDE